MPPFKACTRRRDGLRRQWTGEAREADVGIAAGDGEGLLFKNGEKVRKIPEEQMINVLIEEINQF